MKQLSIKFKDVLTKKNVLICLEFFALLFCFVKMVLNLNYGTEAEFQTIRDRFNFCAIFYFMIAVLIINRAKVWHWSRMIYLVLFTIAQALFFKINVYESELFMDYLMKWHACGLFGLAALDMIIDKKYIVWRERNKVLTILYLLALIYMAFISLSRSQGFTLLIPFLLFYFVKIDQKTWMKLMIIISIAIPAAGGKLMLSSLMDVPYTGERYFGVFLNISTIGMFMAGGAICALYWLVKKSENRWKRPLIIVLSIIVMSLMYIFVSMISARVAIVAFFCTLFFTMIFWPNKHNQNEIKRRVIIAMFLFVIMLGLIIVIMYLLKTVDMTVARNLIKNDILYNKFAYWQDRGETIFVDESEVFGSGNIFSMIDRVFSGRISIWWFYAHDINLFGHKGVCGISSGYIHPHNNYMAILFSQGIVGSLFVFAWLGCLVNSVIKKSIEGKEIYILPSMWIVLTLLSMVTETLFWIYTLPFIMLIMQYPYLIDIEEKSFKVLNDELEKNQ